MSIFSSVEELLSECGKRKAPLWRLVMEYSAHESGIEPQKSWDEMSCRLCAMRDAAASYEPEQRSRSGLSGGDGAKMERYYRSGRSIGGDFTGEILTAALRMGECNACMHRIVAAPTAGACGVMPAVLLPLWRSGSYNEEAICRALYVSAGFGQVVAARATLAGAEGGCQAEVGTASAMAAASSVYLMGGSPEQCFAAAGLAIQNMLGLVCDPIAGLVEAPCQARNAAGASNALVSAELVLAGVPEVIPFDEVVEAARQVGHALPESLRETALGGIAATPTACRLAEQTGCGSCRGCG